MALLIGEQRDLRASAPSCPAQSDLPVEPADLWLHAWGRHAASMAIAIEYDFDDRLDVARLDAAARAVLAAEPVLGCRLDLRPPAARWRPVAAAGRPPLVAAARHHDEYEAARSARFDATTGVQLALHHLRGADGDRLLVRMTHEAGDGVSLQRVVATLAAAYAGDAPAPGAHRGRRDFRQLLAQVPLRAYPRVARDWTALALRRTRRAPLHTLPLPGVAEGPWAPVVVTLPGKLPALAAYARTRGATMTDLFLAAAYRALAARGGWDGAAALRIAMTVDLRRWCGVADTAASNLSSVEYPFLERGLGGDLEATLARVAALTRRRKDAWPGLAPALVGQVLMSVFARQALAAAGGDAPPPPAHPGYALSLSNEGRLDGLQFGPVRPRAARFLPAALTPPALHVTLSSYGDVLSVVALAPANARATLLAFMEALVAELSAADSASVAS